MSKSLKIVAACGLCAAALVVSFSAGSLIGQEKKVSRVYELRTYTTLEGRLPALHARFKNHTMRLFEKHGMKNEMYWSPTDEVKSKNTLIYIVSHESLDAARRSWSAFRDDPEWHKVRDESEKDGKIVEKVDAVYMTLAEFSPAPK